MAINNDKYKEKKWAYVSVKIGTEATIKYAFRTHINSGKATILGHTALTNANSDTTVIGAQYPRPPRASGQLSNGGYVSSFVGTEAVAAAKAAGFTIQRSKARPDFGKKANSTTLQLVLSGGLGYGWRTSLATEANITASGQKAALGITDLLTEIDAKTCVFGTIFPRPAKFKMTVKNGEETNHIGSFCKHDAKINTSENILSFLKTSEELSSLSIYDQLIV